MTDVTRPISVADVRTGDLLATSDRPRLVVAVERNTDTTVLRHPNGHTEIPTTATCRVTRNTRVVDHDEADRTPTVVHTSSSRGRP